MGHTQKELRQMTADRLREIIEKWGTSQNALARFLQVDPRTMRRWALDELPVPISVALALELMVKFKVSPERAYIIANLEPPDEK
jgi:ribosome-binding protein aMBF1 (putative translation factor)